MQTENKYAGQRILNYAKEAIKQNAIQIYNDMAEDTLMGKSEYMQHYSDLGELCWQIDQCPTLPKLLKMYEEGEFDHIGLYVDSDEPDCYRDFLKYILKDTMFEILEKAIES